MVEQFQSIAEPPERVLTGDREDLRVDRRERYREYLHVGRLEGREVFFEPLLSLALAEQRLAEKVEIHPQALTAAGGEVLVQQLWFGRQHDIGGLVLEVRLDERDGHRRQPVPERLEAAQKCPIERAEESRDALHVENVSELLGGAGGSVGTERLVGELHQRGLVGRVLQHPVEFGLLPPLGWRLEAQRLPLELSREPDGGVDEQLVRVHGAASVTVSEACSLLGGGLPFGLNPLQEPEKVAVGREHDRTVAAQRLLVGVERLHEAIKVSSLRARCIGLRVDL